MPSRSIADQNREAPTGSDGGLGAIGGGDFESTLSQAARWTVSPEEAARVAEYEGVTPPAPPRKTTTASRPAPGGGAAGSGPHGGASGAVDIAAANDLAEERYGYMRWALDHPELGPILRDAAARGLGPDELRGLIYRTRWFREHGMANAVAQVQSSAQDYLVPLSDDAARDWAFKMVTKEVQTAEYQQYLRNQAKSMFPSMAGAIDRGVTPRQYVEPYRQTWAQELEVSPDGVKVTDPRFLHAFTQKDAKGDYAAMSLAEFQTYVRTQPEWRKTRGAMERVATLGEHLLETFGKVA